MQAGCNRPPIFPRQYFFAAFNPTRSWRRGFHCSFRAPVAKSSHFGRKPFRGHFLDAATARSMTGGARSMTGCVHGMTGGSINRFPGRAGTRRPPIGRSGGIADSRGSSASLSVCPLDAQTGYPVGRQIIKVSISFYSGQRGLLFFAEQGLFQFSLAVGVCDRLQGPGGVQMRPVALRCVYRKNKHPVVH